MARRIKEKSWEDEFNRLSRNMEAYHAILGGIALSTGSEILDTGDLCSHQDMNEYLYTGKFPEEY